MLGSVQDSLVIGAKIRLALSSLSTKEKIVAEWLLVKGHITQKSSIKYVSDSLAVSDALVVKLAKKLGFSGYRELRSSLVEYFASLPFENEADIKVDDSDTVKTVLNKVFTNTLSAIQEAYAIVNTDDIELAAKKIYASQKVIILGVGGSATVCRDFEHKLLRIGIHSHSYSDFHLMLMAVCQLTKNDTVVVVSQSGTTQEVVKATQIAKKAGAQIVCITNNHKSPLAEIADISIFSPIKGGALLGNNATARIIQLNLIDVLFIAIVLQDYDISNEKLVKSASVYQTQKCN